MKATGKLRRPSREHATANADALFGIYHVLRNGKGSFPNRERPR
jgi:hypothetical protein